MRRTRRGVKRRPRGRRIRLVDIAHARSGDKGDTANVGVIARKPEWYPVLANHLTLGRVREHFQGVIEGDVERYELPNLKALNFLREQGFKYVKSVKGGISAWSDEIDHNVPKY